MSTLGTKICYCCLVTLCKKIAVKRRHSFYSTRSEHRPWIMWVRSWDLCIGDGAIQTRNKTVLLERRKRIAERTWMYLNGPKWSYSVQIVM